jgi:hypothetical protein
MRRIEYFAPTGAGRNRRAADAKATARRLNRLFSVPGRDSLNRIDALRAYGRTNAEPRLSAFDRTV